MNNLSSDKDLHYLVTRIINPYLNSIIATLHDNRVVHYRDGTLDVKEYSVATLVAEILEDWRDELWHKYAKMDLSAVYMDFIDDYSSIINYAYSRLYHASRELAEEIKPDLILLGQKIEEYLTGRVEVFSDFTFNVEKRRLENIHQKHTPKLPEKRHGTKPEDGLGGKQRKKGEESPKIGVCPRCASYERDHSEKKLYQCPYCGEWFCEKHLRPSLVMTFDKYMELWGKYKDLRDVLEKEWHDENSHPCPVYTQKFWEDYEESKKASKDLISGREPVHEVKRLHAPIYAGTSKKRRPTSSPPKPSKPVSVHRKKKSRGKYVVVGFVILLLILAGYLYSQGATVFETSTSYWVNTYGEEVHELA